MKTTTAKTILLFLSLFTLISSFTLTSDDIVNNEYISDEFTPYGEDLSPSFEWSDAPKETKSFAFSCEDPDAPSGLFYHWVVVDIPDFVYKVEKGKVPKGGKQIKNSWGIKNYKGPRPPSGTHHYHFVIYALDTPRTPIRSYQDFKSMIEGHVLAQSEIVGLYKSKNN